MRVQDQKLTLPQLPIIMHSHNTVSVLTPSVHDGTARCQEVILKLFTLFQDVLAIINMEDLAVYRVGGDRRNNPGYFSGSDPS